MMLDLGLTKKQVAFRKQLRHFVDTEILPVARENDLRHHVDRNIIAWMGKLGLLGITIASSRSALRTGKLTC